MRNALLRHYRKKMILAQLDIGSGSLWWWESQICSFPLRRRADGDLQRLNYIFTVAFSSTTRFPFLIRRISSWCISTSCVSTNDPTCMRNDDNRITWKNGGKHDEMAASTHVDWWDVHMQHSHISLRDYRLFDFSTGMKRHNNII